MRDILRTLGLPEDHVIVIKRYGMGTFYELPKSVKERKALLKQVELERIRTKLLKAIVKAVRSIDRQANARLELTDDGKPKQLEILIDRLLDEHEEAERRAIVNELKEKGFEVEEWLWYVRGVKRVILKGTETVKELQLIAKEMMMR